MAKCSYRGWHFWSSCAHWKEQRLLVREQRYLRIPAWWTDLPAEGSAADFLEKRNFGPEDAGLKTISHQETFGNPHWRALRRGLWEVMGLCVDTVFLGYAAFVPLPFCFFSFLFFDGKWVLILAYIFIGAILRDNIIRKTSLFLIVYHKECKVLPVLALPGQD